MFYSSELEDIGASEAALFGYVFPGFIPGHAKNSFIALKLTLKVIQMVAISHIENVFIFIALATCVLEINLLSFYVNIYQEIHFL